MKRIMILYNEQLRILYDMVCRKRHLEKKHQELTEQKYALSDNVNKLNKVRLKEQADVDKLEGGSLSAFFYNVIGKMDEKLTKEREEAYAAAVKYDGAVKELEKVKEDLEKNKEKIKELGNCAEQYEELLEVKKERMKASGHWAAEKILEFEQRLTYFANQERELKEALEAGAASQELAKAVLDSLSTAESWGTLDVLGGGLVADAVKYSKLDEAQIQIEDLQAQLRRFKTELADITIAPELNVKVAGFLQFADYFFDNLFTDCTVIDMIRKAQKQIENTMDQIRSVMEKLMEMKQQVKIQQEAVQKKLDELIVLVNI